MVDRAPLFKPNFPFPQPVELYDFYYNLTQLEGVIEKDKKRDFIVHRWLTAIHY